MTTNIRQPGGLDPITVEIVWTRLVSVVDEAALITALEKGRLAGAGIDTYEQIDIFAERLPPRLHPLSDMDNVILTPHVAAGSEQAFTEIYAIAIENILDILRGYWPSSDNIVNPTVSPRFPLVARVP